MLFKKYKKLRKYVNGVATDEYKKGELIGITTADNIYECEGGDTPIVPTLPTIIRVETTIENEIVKFGDDTYTFQGTIDPLGGTVLSNSQCQFATPGVYTINTYPYNAIASIPVQTIEILDWGEVVDIAKVAFFNVNDSRVTKLPYGKKLFSRLSSISGSDSSHPVWQDPKITDVADNIFQNCGDKITYMLPQFAWNISEDKYTQILSYFTNLKEIHFLFKDTVLITSTCGIFKNNPNLIDIDSAFLNTNIITVAEDEFSNNPDLDNVRQVFAGCEKLINMPNFRENKKIHNFTYAFEGCTSLKGSTPVDENGYKLWERAGKPGYPATIDGTNCFSFCKQLDDYDLIPDNWK